MGIVSIFAAVMHKHISWLIASVLAMTSVCCTIFQILGNVQARGEDFIFGLYTFLRVLEARPHSPRK